MFRRKMILSMELFLAPYQMDTIYKAKIVKDRLPLDADLISIWINKSNNTVEMIFTSEDFTNEEPIIIEYKPI